MAILKVDDAQVGRREDNRVVLRLPVDGTTRNIVFEPEAALRVGTTMANAGVDGIGTGTADELPLVSKIRLLPYQGNGAALLEVTMDNFGGPALMRIDHNWLRALATAANAALEMAEPGGTA